MWGEADAVEVTKEQIRQALLERYTPDMYERLSHAAVAVAGLGGLGSHAAVMLARAGVGKLLLVDFDRVELSNLNRQAYSLTHLGQWKTRAMQQILREINPYLILETKNCCVTNHNAAELFGEYPILCEAFDDSGSKAMLVNTMLEQTKNTVIVSGSGMAGCGSGNEIQTKRAMNRLYLCGDGKTELKPDVCLMASRVTICAAHQANMIIRLILGMEEV